MARELRCADLMPGCNFVAQGKDDSEVMKKAAEHARALIEKNDSCQVWALVGGYEDSPWPPRWDRLKEIAIHPGRHAPVTRDLREYLERLARDEVQEARELLSLLN